MNWVRFASAGAALAVHVAVLGLFVASVMHEPDHSALQSGSGDDDLTIVATITMQSEESLGLDAVSIQRQEASLGGQAAPQVEVKANKEEEKVELPPEESPQPSPLVQEREPEKKIVEVTPSTPAPSSEAQDEQRAATRAFDARRNEVLSLYNSRVYQALMKNALRPKTTQKGRVVLELTLAPTGELLDHHVVVSSGSLVLDKTALTSLERAAPFPPVPSEVSKQSHTLRVPFEYAVK
jgi:periplasmic protein TonB